MKAVHLLASAIALAVPAMLLADTTRVAVSPAQILGGDASHAWLGRAVQENLIIEIGRIRTADSSRTFEPVAFAGRDTGKSAASVKAGLAVVSTAQIAGSDVRLTSQILRVDVRGTTSVVGTASATGSQSNMLKVQDELTTQVRNVVIAAPAGRVLVIETTPVRERIVEQPVREVQQDNYPPFDLTLSGATRNGGWVVVPQPVYSGYNYYGPTYGYGYGYGYGGYYWPNIYGGGYYGGGRWSVSTYTPTTTQGPVNTPNGGRAWPAAHGTIDRSFSGGLR